MSTLKFLLSSLTFAFPSSPSSSPNHFSKLPFFLSLKSCHAICTADEEKEEEERHRRHNAFTDFLLKECGVSESQLSTIMRRSPYLFMSTSTQRAREALELLRASGFTPDQVRRTIVRAPTILSLKVDTQLTPKIELIKNLGLTAHDVGKVISKSPRILSASLDKKFSVELLEKMCGSKTNLCKAVKTAPVLLLFNFDKQIKPRLDILKQFGIQGELLSFLIAKRAEVLGCNEASLKLKLEYVSKLGYLEGSKRFVIALSAAGVIGSELLEKKREHMGSLGLQENEIKEIFRKHPHLLNYSMSKMRKNLEFLVDTVGFQPGIVISYPMLLTFSIEKRMHPRYKVLEYLSLTLSEKGDKYVASFFNLPERTFVKKFLKENPQAVLLYTKAYL